MVSLTTVYLVSVILTSIAGFGSVFASKKFVGGSSNITVDDLPEILERDYKLDKDTSEQITSRVKGYVSAITNSSGVPTHSEFMKISDQLVQIYNIDKSAADRIASIAEESTFHDIRSQGFEPIPQPSTEQTVPEVPSEPEVETR
jgi:hypothetical protein